MEYKNRKKINVIILDIILISLGGIIVSCNQKYDYPSKTFLEKLEFPFNSNLFLHCTNNKLNIIDFLYCPDFEKGCFINESVAQIIGNDTTEFHTKNKYIFSKKENFIYLDGSIHSFTINYDTLFNNIQSIEVSNKQYMEYIYDDQDKLIQLNCYWQKNKEYLYGYCLYTYSGNKIIEENWYDVKDYNTKKIHNRKISYQYDENNKLVCKKVYNNKNTLVRVIQYTYHKHNQIVTDMFIESKKSSSSNIYIYDNFNRLLSCTETTYYTKDSIEYENNNGTILKTLYRYNINNKLDSLEKISKFEIEYII